MDATAVVECWFGPLCRVGAAVRGVPPLLPSVPEGVVLVRLGTCLGLLDAAGGGLSE